MAYNNLQLPKLPTMNGLGSLPTLPTLPELPTIPKIAYQQYKRTNQQVSPFSDYNDPTQINSLADVVWNSLYKNDDLKTRDYGVLSDVGDWDIPLISGLSRAVTGTIDLARNTVIEPIKQGNMAAVGINTLVNLGESLDILASPIKGLVLDGPEGLIKGSVGRVNYDFDTGNMAVDILAEVLFDPFNWFSFGSKMILSRGAKMLLTSSIDDIAQAAGGKVLKEGLEEATQKSLKTKIIAKAKKELFDAQGKFIAKSSDEIYDSLFRAVNSIGSDYFDDAFLTAIRDKQINKLTPMYINDLRILRGVQGIANITDKAEKIMFEGAMYSNFIPIEQLKKVKNWGMFKNYTNKIITEVGQVVNGYLNPTELTKLANYNTVTNPKKLEYKKMKINQILKEGGLETLSYIDIDNAFSEQAIKTIQEAKLSIEQYYKTRDFDTLVKQLTNLIVPENIINSSDTAILYKNLIETMDGDLNLIKTKLNKDGIQIFSNIEKSYESLKNTIENVKNYDEAIKAIKKAQQDIISKDAVLTPANLEFVAKYKQNTNAYTEAYESLLTRISGLHQELDELLSSSKGMKLTTEDVKKYANNYLNRLLHTHLNKVTKDVNALIEPFIEDFKNVTTITDLDRLLRILDASAKVKKDNLVETQFIKTIYGSAKEKTVEQIRTEVIKHQVKGAYANRVLGIIKSYKLSKSTPNPKQVIKDMFKNISEFTTSVPEKHLADIEGFINLIDTTKKNASNVLDINEAYKFIKNLTSTLQDKKTTSQSVVAYGNYLLNNSPIIKQYKDVVKQLKRSQRALYQSTSGEIFTKLRNESTGGFSAFDKVKEQVYKKQHLSDNPVTLATETNKEVKTIFNTNNVGVTTIDTPESAFKTFNLFFNNANNVESSTYGLLKQVNVFGDLSYDIELVEQCQDLLSYIDEIKIKLKDNPDYFKIDNNLMELKEFFDDLKAFSYSVKTNYETAYKSGKRGLGIRYNENGDPITHLATKTTAYKDDKLVERSYKLNLESIEAIAEREAQEGIDDITEQLQDKVGNLSDAFKYDGENLEPEFVDSYSADIEDIINADTQIDEFTKVYSVEASGETELNTLRTLIDGAWYELNQIASFDTANKIFEAGAVSVLYAAKDENLALLYNALSSDNGLAANVQSFLHPGTLVGRELRAILNDTTGGVDFGTKLAAEQFYNDIVQFQALSNFVSRITSDPDIPEGLNKFIMSSLESFKNTTLGELDIDIFNKEWFKRINNFIYGVDNVHSLSIQNLLTEASIKVKHNDVFKKRYDDLAYWEKQKLQQFFDSGETHQAADDAFVQDILIRLYMPDDYISEVVTKDNKRVFLNKNKGRIYVSDCETSGKKGPINELAIRAMGSNDATECVVFKVAYHNDWELPQNDVLTKMFPDDSYDTAVAKYKALYDPNTPVNKKAIEEGTTLFYNSEKEMLEGYKRYIDNLRAGDEIIMHNGTEFDFPVIRQRAYDNGIYFNTKKIQLTDSLLEMKNYSPLVQLDSGTKIKISNYIKQYISELPEDPSIQFLSAANYRSLINLIEFEKQLRNSLSSSSSYNQELLNALNYMKEKYFNLLSTNSKISKSANGILISKEFFQTKEGQDILLDEIKKAKKQTEDMLTKKYFELTPKQRDEYYTYLKQLDDTLELAKQGLITNNISRTMYIDRFEGDPALGFIKIVDLDTARNYMDIPNDAKLSLNELKAITNFTRPLKNSYDAIKNVDILIANKQKIAKYLRNIIDAFGNTNNIIAPSWLKYIRINPEDYKTNYILLQKLYNQYTKQLKNSLSVAGITGGFDTLDKATGKYIKERIPVIADEINSKYKSIKEKIESVIDDVDIQNLLNDSSALVYNKATPEFSVFDSVARAEESVEKFKERITNDITDLGKEYKMFVNNFNTLMDRGLKGLGDTLDTTAFTSAFKFKTAQQAKQLTQAIESLVKYLDDLGSPTKQAEVIKNIERASDLIKVNIAKQITELSDEQLLNHLLTNSMVLQLDTKFLNDFDTNILKNFLQRKDDLIKNHIQMELNEDLGILIIYPDKEVGFKTIIDETTGKSLYEINGTATEPNQLLNINVEEFLDFLPDNVRKDFKLAQESINHLTNDIGAGTTYEIVDRSFYRKVYEQLPKTVQNNMLDIEYFMKDALFNKRSRFNTTILGSQQFCSMYGDYIPGNFVKGYLNSFITLASRASDKANYIEMILNKDFSINNGIINELSFDEVRKMLEDAPEFNLACLVYNKSGTPELIDLKLNTEVDFQFAKKNNAVILPYHVFATAYGIINSQMYEEMNPIVEKITKVMHMYKRGYLMSEGTVMRNTIDTFAKNFIMAEGNVKEVAIKTMEACKLYMDYNDTLNAIFKSSKNGRINKEAITNFFKNGLNNKMDYEKFSFVHEVLNSGALIGEVKSLDNYRIYSKARKEGLDVANIKDLNDPAIKGLLEDYDSVKHSLNGLMRVNNSVENIQRLSAYMLLREKGLNFTEAIYRVAKDHFNYSMKSPRERLIELIIPFYTFKINNLQYWAEALVDNPWIAGLYEDIMTPIWNFDDVDEDELKYNRSLQYRLTSGNAQLTDSGLTLKLNPSASDAFKLMTNPLGEIYNSVFALYTFVTDSAMTQIAEASGNRIIQGANELLNIYKPSNPTKLDKFKSLINLAPYGSIAQRYVTGAQYAKEINNILPAIVPGVFGRTKQYEQWDSNKSYKKYKSGGYGKKSYSYKRKVYPRRTYPKKAYYKKPYQPYSQYPDYYPINFKNIYIDGMYSVPNISTYTAQANRYYHFPRLNKLPTVSIYDKLYTAKGKPRWDAMLQTVTPQNLKYVIKNTIHYK